MRQFLVFALVCVLSACTKVGRPISPADTDQVTKGVTTREELLNRFGPPYLLSEDANGNKMVTWVYVRSSFLGVGYKSQAFTARFDSSGKVIDSLLTEKSEPTARR
jgi:outer membrane protein assembly factor BamE (lipoprotein component of BamABCDE complex)